MLPQDRHEIACRLFCRILRRLEERDKGHDHQTSTTTSDQTGHRNADMETGASDSILCATVPPRIIARAEEER